MDKRLAGLLGAVAALTTVSAAHATAPSQTELAPPTSYQDLLAPIPNAVAAVKADDARLAQAPTDGEQIAQNYHHHHHRYYRRHRHHHHHHHHYSA